MKKSKAFCPASISLIFRVWTSEDLIKMGTTGVGFTINEGVVAEVKLSDKNIVRFNDEEINFPTVKSVIKSLTSRGIEVDFKSHLPLGFGFGLSGACSLSAAYSINSLLNLGKSDSELVRKCHMAEVINRTGLGTVGTQSTGGFLLKLKPGLPVRLIKYPFLGRKLFAVIVDKLETPIILENKNIIKKVNIAADFALESIRKKRNISLEEIIDISYDFARHSLLLEMSSLLDLVVRIRKRGIHATMTMVGKVLICDKYPDIKMNYKVKEITVSDNKITDLY